MAVCSFVSANAVVSPHVQHAHPGITRIGMAKGRACRALQASIQSRLQEIQIAFCATEASTRTPWVQLANRHVRTVHRALIRKRGRLRWKIVFAMPVMPEATARAQHARLARTKG